MADKSAAHPYKCELRVAFSTPEHAEAARTSLSVDRVLQPENVTRTFSVEGSELVARIACADLRTLRVTVNSFHDMTAVVVRTLQEFP